MSNIIKLAKKAGLPILAWEEETKAFYTLARADLEASNKQLQHDLNEQLYQVKAYDERCQDLEAENASLWKEREEPLKDAALFMSECNRLERERADLEAENAKLRKALERVYVTCDWHGDDGRDAMQAAHAALGENK